MKSHKKMYFVPSTSCDDCMELVMVHRKPKPKSPMRRVMWKAFWFNYIESYNKKHKIDEYMKGTLQSDKEKGWIVKYKDELQNQPKELPVHPDDIHVIENSPTPVNPRVEFYIVSISLPQPDRTVLDIDVARIVW